MNKINVKIINRSNNPNPSYATPGAAGMDVRAYLQEPVTIKPLQRVLVPTGFYVELPEGYEIQMRPRSGLALKSGITLANTPGTIDADYRGEIGVILINLSDQDFVVNPGERICQMVVTTYTQISWQDVDAINDTERGAGGFGHTSAK
jgi:dUTP pyrophosphatase